MEYGLRRYEAIQRLLWLFFLVLCLAAAYFTQNPSNYPAAVNPQLKGLKTTAFWTGLHGILMAPPAAEVSREKLPGQAEPGPSPGITRQAPPERRPAPVPPADPSSSQTDPQFLSRIMLFLVRAGIIFLVGRLLWLVAQFLAKFVMNAIMSESIKRLGPPKQEFDTGPIYPERLFPRQLLLDKIRQIPLGFLFHPFMRLRLMLSGFGKSVSSEEMIEKERRIVETDWQVLYSSWGPFRWLLWLLPMAALAQSAWFFFIQVQNASVAQKELLDSIQTLPNAVLPLAQAVGIVVIYKLASAFLRRMEDLYLSNLDALLYDRLLSRLPFHSGDTVIVLQTLQRQFQEVHAALRRLERAIQPERKNEG
ncbi:MAG: hypothetical protein ABFD97_05365 [Syntrophobacter sp.]